MTHVHMRKLENYVVLIDHVAYQCSIEKKLLIAIIKEKCVYVDIARVLWQ